MPKRSPNELAVLGGMPLFSSPLHVGRPNLGDRHAFLKRLNEALDRRWLTNNGALVREFEERVATIASARHCVAMCNATIAMEVAAKACGLTGEVIVPAFTFVATAHALNWIGLEPVFCDIDPDTHNIDPVAAERLITPRTSAILAVHVWGRPCDVTALTRLAARNNLTLLFDAAHAFACGAGGRMIGGFGAAEIFSFHATKFVNSFEGGALVTNDDDLARRVRLMNNFGFAGVDRILSPGTNAKMHEASAAMGLTSLDSLGDIVATNRAHYEQYEQALCGVGGVRLAAYDKTEPCNFQYVIVEIDPDVAGLTRDELKDILWAENVHARRYFYPGCHRVPPYNQVASQLPHTERLTSRVLSLPTGTGVSSEEVAVVTETIRFCLEHAAEIQGRLRRSIEASA